MSDYHVQTYLRSPEQTYQLAADLGQRLLPGDVLLLSGGVGAGKTHFARSLIQSLQHTPEDVPSPTFTLVQTYETPAGDIWHTDLYRLTGLNEIDELGLTEAFETAICLVEWPDRLGDAAPKDALSLMFEYDIHDEARHLTFCWSAPRWAENLKGIIDVSA